MVERRRVRAGGKEFFEGRVTLYRGDCLDVLPTLSEASFDSCVCDPPYHLHSIVKRFGANNAAQAKSGKTGVYARSSRGFMGKRWDGGDVAFRSETWAEVLRVLKPGAYLLAFSSCRTFGRMSVAIEDAGFITHPLIAWVFGSGFPKAHRVDDSEWDGWRYGAQALKPAIEPIYMGQKPFSEENGTANVRRWGTGALNIDGCRIEGRERVDYGLANSKRTRGMCFGEPSTSADFDSSKGRWPANLIHDGSDDVVGLFPYSAGNSGGVIRDSGADSVARGKFTETLRGGYGGGDGSAARFFYTAKANAEDRESSKHPTVKPLDLMQYLVRLVTPPRGMVLDPFAGTGTTGQAAYREGLRATLIEREDEYAEDVARRMERERDRQGFLA